MLLAPWPWGLTVMRAAGSESGATRWPLSGWLMGQTLQHGGAGQFLPQGLKMHRQWPGGGGMVGQGLPFIFRLCTSS